MSWVTKWLRANRIWLNVAKTETILFRSENTIITKKMSFRICNQKIKTKKQTNDLEIIKDDHLSSAKQNTALATGLFARLRNYVQLRV